MKQAALLIVVVVLVVGGLGPGARADDLTVGKMTYKGVEIRDVSAGKIGFMFYERLVYKPLADVAAVRLAKAPTFNKAEEFMARKKFDQAIALYTVARAAAKGKWQGPLIDYRLALAVLGKIDSPMASAVAGGSSPAAKPADPLASADAFADLVNSMPVQPPGITGSKLSSLPPHLARVWRQYTARHAIWEKKVIRLRGKKATWEVIFQSAVPVGEFLTPSKSRRPARRPARSGSSRKTGAGRPQGPPATWATGFVVEAASTGGAIVLANVLSTNAKGLKSLKPNEIVEIAGRIRRDLEADAASYELYLGEAVVKPTGRTAKPKEPETAKKTKSTR